MLKYVRLLSFSFTNKWQLTELAENTCKPFFKNYYSISIFLFSCEIQPCWYLRLRFPLNSWWFVIMSACLGICLSPWIKQCIIYKFHGESGMSFFFFFFCLQIHVSFSGKFPYNRFVCVCVTFLVFPLSERILTILGLYWLSCTQFFFVFVSSIRFFTALCMTFL